MQEVTLESLAKRVEALEQAIKNQEHQTAGRDWWNVVGTIKDDEFMRSIVAEGRAIREAEREAANREAEEELEK